MPGRFFMAVVLVAMALTIASCERLPRPQKPAPTLKLEALPFTDAVPADFGDLVSVTVDPSMPYSVQLWFQKPDKSVALVFLDYRNHFIGPQYMHIPRR